MKQAQSSSCVPQTEINREYSEIWPVITEKKEPPIDAEKWQGVENKFQDYFSKKPGI